MKRAATTTALVLILTGCSSPSQPPPAAAKRHTKSAAPVTAAPTSTAMPATCHVGPENRPDPICTPGVLNPAVTQQTIRNTICVVGWTATIRPPVTYTEPLKIKQIAAYGYTDTNVADYEEDHLVPLELGGDPADPHNLWPEAHNAPGSRGSTIKDLAENALRVQICNGVITLAQAQTKMLSDWGPVKTVS